MNVTIANSSSPANETGAYLNSPGSDPDPEDQCPLPPVGAIFLISMEILTAVTGFPGNVCVVYLMLRGKVERSTSDIFTLSLAVLDTVYCLSLPLHPLNLFLLHGVDVYRLRLFLLGLNEVGGPLFLSCICIDRYIAVVHPILFLKLNSGHHRSIVAALMWLTTLVHSSVLAGSLFQYTDCIFVAVFLAAFLVILFCNVFVLRALRQSGPASGELHPIKQRAFSTVLTIFIIIVITFLPAALIYPFEHLLPGRIYICYVFPICYAFITLRAALQALFFLARVWKPPCVTCDLAGRSQSTANCLCC